MRKLLCLLLLLPFVACRNERLEGVLLWPERQAPQEIVCTIGEELPDEDTRTSLAGQVGVGDQPVSWTAGDKVSIFPECNDHYGYVTADTGVVTATFTQTSDPVIPGAVAESHAGIYYGVYPYHPENAMAGGIATVTLPAEQTCATTMADPAALLMSAKSESLEMNFRNNPSMIRFRLCREGMEGITIQKIRVTSASAWLAGRGTVEIAADEPTLVITNDAATASHSVTLTLTDAVALKEADDYTPFYLVLAPGTYNDLTFEFETSQGNFFSDLSGTAVTFERGAIQSIRRTFRPEDFKGTTENEKWVDVSGEIELN